MEEILKQLDSDDVEVRRQAVGSLRGRQSAEAVPLLLRAMEDRSWRVRKAAAEILISGCPLGDYIGGLIGLLGIEDDAGARNAAIEALVRLGKRATTFLMAAFDTPNRDVRKFIIDIIGEVKDRQALPLLLKSLKDEDDNVRASAVEHLGRLAEPSVVDALIDILRSGDTWTAFPAADALGRIGDRRAVPALVEALAVRALREPVLKSLGRLSVVGTLDYVVPLLRDKSRAVQEETIKAIEMYYHNNVPAEVISGALNRLCGPESIAILVNHAWSRKREVRAAAILLLGLLQDERALSPLLDLSSEEDLADEVKGALIYIGKNRPDYIMPLFRTDNQAHRRFIIEVAATVASPLFARVFEQNLRDVDGHVRALSAQGLANIGDGGAVPALMELLADPYQDVQEAAVKALIRLKAFLPAEDFIRLLKERLPSLRRNAALVLGRIREEGAVSALGFALKDEDVTVRKAVIEALSLIRTSESVRHLMFALTDEDADIRTSAALSLGSLGDAVVYESLSLLTADSQDNVRAAAARALGMLGDPRAIEGLIALLGDPNGFVVTAALKALGRIRGEKAREAVIGMLGSGDPEIRRTTIAALAPFGGVADAVIPFLSDPDWATRMAAVETLGKAPDDRVRTEVEHLYEREEDPAVRRAIEERFHVR